MELFQITDKNILGLIVKLTKELKEGENLGKLRSYFSSGEREGQLFIDGLHYLQRNGYIKNVQFILDSNNYPYEAVWSHVVLTRAGLDYYKKMNGNFNN